MASRRAPAAGRLAIVASLQAAAALLFTPAGFAYGPAGHRIAGAAAAPELCARAAAEIARLGDGAGLGELGLWADQIRSDPAYADAAPWHYVNAADAAELAALAHAPDGDVLWAIEHFRARLGDERLADAARAEALRFLVHFVVDLHQPLHVGLAADRGGNEVTLRFRGQSTNLHRFWDTHAIEQAGLDEAEYLRRVRQAMAGVERPLALDPMVWAGESLALRPTVYAFGAPGREPARAYLETAAELTRTRLAQAAVRLAATLNGIFCA